MFYYSDGIFQELIPVFDTLIVNVYGITRTIYKLILKDIDAIILGIAEIDGIFAYMLY